MSQAITLEHWLRSEPFELSLGAGFFGFYAHVGFIKALEEKNLKPERIYGSSAGAIVGAFLARAYSASQLEEIFLKITRTDFWDPSLGFGILKGNKFNDLLNEYLPKSFHELKIPLEISTFDVFSLRTKIFKSGDLHSAIRGSSAFPLLFQPVKIENKFYLDGGIADEHGLSERSTNTRLLIHSFGKFKSIDQKENQVLVSLKNLPRSGPTRMHLARKIMDQAYLQTQQRLQSLLK